jgi:hypothetical protein
MHYRLLPVFCECGQPPSRITGVGLTANHELLIRWWCDGCNRTVYATKRLAECWKDCPKPNGAETILGDDCEFDGGEGDAKFLAGLGVKFPESQ